LSHCREAAAEGFSSREIPACREAVEDQIRGRCPNGTSPVAIAFVKRAARTLTGDTVGSDDGIDSSQECGAHGFGKTLTEDEWQVEDLTERVVGNRTVSAATNNEMRVCPEAID
jgi:hypothetical protein